MKKQFWIAGAVFLYMTGTPAGAQESYGEYMVLLKESVPQKALESENEWLVEYGDFTGDGTDEMVAFVYEVTGHDEEIVYGQYYLCYSTQNAVTICDTLYGGFYKSPEIFHAGKSTIMFYTIGYGGPSGESFCWKFADDGLTAAAVRSLPDGFGGKIEDLRRCADA